MHLLKTFEQVAEFEPTNPNQRSRIIWTNDNYNSFYFDKRPNESSLMGLSDFSTLPSYAQIGIVGAISAVIGYFAMAKFGTDYIKPALRKVGINLSGPRGQVRRRRR